MICKENDALFYPLTLAGYDFSHLCALVVSLELHMLVVLTRTDLAPARVPDLYDNGILEEGHGDKYGAGEQPQINEGEGAQDG